jgi:hypothetical protein
VPNQYRSKYAKAPKDERTKFDKWLDQCITEKKTVWFLMYDQEEVTCFPVQTDRYMLQVNVGYEEGDDVELIWLNKGAILKAAENE